MKNKIIVLGLLLTFGVVFANAQGQGNIIKYINENKLYRNGNDVTVTDIDLEWPVELEGDGMPVLQKELCKQLLDVDATSMEGGWIEFHKGLGNEIKQMPDSVSRHYLYIHLEQLWNLKGQYVSLMLKRQLVDENGKQVSGAKEFLTYDKLAGKVITADEAFTEYTTEFGREAFESLLADNSICNDDDKQNIDLTVLPKDFAVAGNAMMIDLGGPVDHDNYSIITLNNLYQLSLFKRSFVKWLEGKAKAKKKEQSLLAPANFDSSLSDDSLCQNITQTPEFPGGRDSLMKFVYGNVQYPSLDMALHTQGRSVVGFIVEKDGSISDVTVFAPLSPTLDREAVRVIRLMPKWTPGEQNGVKVRTRMTVPFTFKLKAN